MKTIRRLWHRWRAHVWSQVMLNQALGIAPRNLMVPLSDLVDPATMFLHHKQSEARLALRKSKNLRLRRRAHS